MGLSVDQRWAGGYLWTSGAITAEERFNKTSGVPTGLFNLSDGTGPNQSNCVFGADFNISATTMQTWDLKGGGGELDMVNAALAFTFMKLVLIQITTPGAGTSLRWGPQGVANAAQLGFQAATANFWKEVRGLFIDGDPVTGWAIGAGAGKVNLYNSGASAVAGKIRIIGTK